MPDQARRHSPVEEHGISAGPGFARAGTLRGPFARNFADFFRRRHVRGENPGFAVVVDFHSEARAGNRSAAGHPVVLPVAGGKSVAGMQMNRCISDAGRCGFDLRNAFDPERGSFSPQCRFFHLFRRRRFLRIEKLQRLHIDIRCKLVLRSQSRVRIRLRLPRHRQGFLDHFN